MIFIAQMPLILPALFYNIKINSFVKYEIVLFLKERVTKLAININKKLFYYQLSRTSRNEGLV